MGLPEAEAGLALELLAPLRTRQQEGGKERGRGVAEGREFEHPLGTGCVGAILVFELGLFSSLAIPRWF